jgi:hypothetical protein
MKPENVREPSLQMNLCLSIALSLFPLSAVDHFFLPWYFEHKPQSSSPNTYHHNRPSYSFTLFFIILSLSLASNSPTALPVLHVSSLIALSSLSLVSLVSISSLSFDQCGAAAVATPAALSLSLRGLPRLHLVGSLLAAAEVVLPAARAAGQGQGRRGSASVARTTRKAKRDNMS